MQIERQLGYITYYDAYLKWHMPICEETCRAD